MPKLSVKIRRDYIAGGLIFLLGLVAVIQGNAYHVGTLTDMGPGFFPVALGVMLSLTGIAIMVVAMVSAPNDDDKSGANKEGIHPPEWVAWACILGGIVAFVVLGRYGGLVPATFVLVFVSMLADRENTWKHALAVAAIMVALAVIVFWWALEIQFPLFSWS